MKPRTILWCNLLLFAACVNNSNAWTTSGRVLCDSDMNGVIDSHDSPLSNVLVNVTLISGPSGTFSASALTGPDGSFTIDLPPFFDNVYMESLDPTTLPADANFLVPTTTVYTFSITGPPFAFQGDFLISSPSCQAGACWLTGGGTLRNSLRNGGPAHSFGGNVFPGCSPTAGDGGNWNDVAHGLRFHFQGRTITNVNCGNVPGIPPGSTSPVTPFNFIEFEGTGRLTGIAGNQARYPLVFFFARCEDRNEPGSRGAKDPLLVDRYYLRVVAPDGTVLLLVSGDTADPLDVVPVPISTGNLQIHISSCDNPPR